MYLKKKSRTTLKEQAATILNRLSVSMHSLILLGSILLILVMSRYSSYLSLVVRKPVFGVFDQVGHKPGCTATEDG